MPDLNIQPLESSPLIIAQSQEKDVQSSHIAERIERAFNRALTFLATILASIRDTLFGSRNSNVEKQKLTDRVTNDPDLQQPLIAQVNDSLAILNSSPKEQEAQKGKEVAKELAINPNVIDIPAEKASEKESLKENVIEDFIMASTNTIQLPTPQSVYSSEIESISKLKAVVPKNEATAKIIAQLIESGENYINSLFLNRFNGVVLDSRPDLHAEIGGGVGYDELLIMKHDIDAFLDSPKGQNLTPAARNLFERCAQKLYEACQIAAITNSHEAIQVIADRIDQLQPKDFLLLVGGSKNHAFLYEIRREEGDNYIFTIINTGAGEYDEYHRNRMDDPLMRNTDLHKSFTYAHKAYRCDRQAFSLGFLEMAFPASMTPAYHVLRSIDEKIKIAGTATEISGRQHHRQGGGTCAIKCVTSALQEIFSGEFDHALLEFKVFRTEEMIGEMKEFEKTYPEFLKGAYKVSTDEELQDKLQQKDEAVEQIYKKRVEKAENAKAIASNFLT